MRGNGEALHQLTLFPLPFPSPCTCTQVGSFVPAARARLGVTDCIFTRIGASDNLAENQSTFMVEMVETAAILRAATPRSFVVLDEVWEVGPTVSHLPRPNDLLIAGSSLYISLADWARDGGRRRAGAGVWDNTAPARCHRLPHTVCHAPAASDGAVPGHGWAGLLPGGCGRGGVRRGGLFAPHRAGRGAAVARHCYCAACRAACGCDPGSSGHPPAAGRDWPHPPGRQQHARPHCAMNTTLSHTQVSRHFHRKKKKDCLHFSTSLG